MTTTVTWVLNGNSQYEISSKDHLIQLMNSGTLYTNAGSVPIDFYDSDYIQTVDIDLQSDSNIVPLGNATDKFTGSYDGANFAISNWSYTDPEFSTANDCANYSGFFGEAQTANINNMRLTGVCTLNGFKIGGGIFAGWLNNCSTANIELDLSPGSGINQGDVTFSWAYIGTMVGYISTGTIFGITVKGEVTNIIPSPSTSNPVLSGVIGFASSTTITLARNLGVFPNGILNGYYVGGVIGYLFRASCSLLMNVMEGTMSTNDQYVGGVVGIGRIDQENSYVVSGLVNSMKGDLIANNTAGTAGGVLGNMWQSSTTGNTFESFLNYMSGDIIHTPGSINKTGGILGRADANPVLLTSINAMNGDVYNTVIGNASGTEVSLATVDTNFGLTFTNDAWSTSSPVTGLPTDSNYFNLPYVALTGTDIFGLTYNWDFVFGNEKSLQLTARALHIIVTIEPVVGAIAYQVTVQNTSSNIVREVVTGFTGTEVNINSLRPITEYNVRLLASSDGIQYNLELENTITTLENSAENYDINDFDYSNGRYDLSDLGELSRQDIYEVINDLFETGDSIIIDIGSINKGAKFVKRGETTSIVGEDALLVPFDSTAGASQSVSLNLSDTSTVVLDFDETTETVSIGGQSYSLGEYTILDGKKLFFKNA